MGYCVCSISADVEIERRVIWHDKGVGCGL